MMMKKVMVTVMAIGDCDNICRNNHDFITMIVDIVSAGSFCPVLGNILHPFFDCDIDRRGDGYEKGMEKLQL